MGHFYFYIFFFQETQAVHMNMTQGSYLEFTVPMVVEENGYEMKINGQLFHLDATTSLAFRSLLDCETFEVRYMDFLHQLCNRKLGEEFLL